MYRGQMSTKQINFSKFEEKEVIPEGYIKVRFIKDIPKFVGIDTKVYGSFSINNISIIPVLNSVGLLKKGGCVVDKS